MNNQVSPTLSAEAILLSPGGTSLATTNEPITSENVEDFLPTPETIEAATVALQDLGFTVQSSATTLTLIGELTRFETVFQVKLGLLKDDEANTQSVQVKGEVILPQTIRSYVAAIVFPPPYEFFGNTDG